MSQKIDEKDTYFDVLKANNINIDDWFNTLRQLEKVHEAQFPNQPSRKVDWVGLYDQNFEFGVANALYKGSFKFPGNIKIIQVEAPPYLTRYSKNTLYGLIQDLFGDNPKNRLENWRERYDEWNNMLSDIGDPQLQKIVDNPPPFVYLWYQYFPDDEWLVTYLPTKELADFVNQKKVMVKYVLFEGDSFWSKYVDTYPWTRSRLQGMYAYFASGKDPYFVTNRPTYINDKAALDWTKEIETKLDRLRTALRHKPRRGYYVYRTAPHAPLQIESVAPLQINTKNGFPVGYGGWLHESHKGEQEELNVSNTGYTGIYEWLQPETEWQLSVKKWLDVLDNFENDIFKSETMLKDVPLTLIDRIVQLTAKKRSIELELDTQIKAVGEAYQKRETKYPRLPQTGRPELPIAVKEFLCKQGVKDPSCCKEVLALPVLRYPRLYYEGRKTDVPYCGKFYFFDPHSDVYLDLGKVGIFASKLHALETLVTNFQPLPDKQRDEVYAKTNPGDHLFLSGKTTAEDISANNWHSNWEDYDDSQEGKATTFFYRTILNTDTKIPPHMVLTKKDGMKIEVGMFVPPIGWQVGLHDYLDQAICFYGRDAGYDTFLFQREYGTTRMVTELLDVRAFSEQHLFRLKTPAKFPFSSKYPTVWFTEFGFVGGNPLTYSSLTTRQAKLPDACKKQPRATCECIPPFASCLKDCVEKSNEWLYRLFTDQPDTAYITAFGQENAYVVKVKVFEAHLNLDMSWNLIPSKWSKDPRQKVDAFRDWLVTEYKRQDKSKASLRITFLTPSFNPQDIVYLNRASRVGQFSMGFNNAFWNLFAPYIVFIDEPYLYLSFVPT